MMNCWWPKWGGIRENTAFLFLIFCLIGLSGCGAFRSGLGSKPGETRLSVLLPQQPKVVKRNIPRDELEGAHKQIVGGRGVRFVRIYRNNAARSVPEHRVFDVAAGSPYYLLGLRSGDILLGINDRIIVEAEVMTAYPYAVLKDGKSSLTVSRNDQILQLEIEVVEG